MYQPIKKTILVEFYFKTVDLGFFFQKSNNKQKFTSFFVIKEKTIKH